MALENQGGILGGLEHIAHRKIDDIVLKFVEKLSPSVKQFLAKNKSWLVGSLDILATISGMLRPNNSKWDIIQTSFSSLVEGLDKAASTYGAKDLSGVPLDEVTSHLITFEKNVGLLSADDEDSKNIAKWIMILQKQNADLAKKAYYFLGSMTQLQLRNFAGFGNAEKTAVLLATLPKEEEKKESSRFLENQRDGLDGALLDLDNLIKIEEKKLRKLRRGNEEVIVTDKDIIAEEDKIVYEADDGKDEETILLENKKSNISKQPTGGWEW